MVLVVGSLPPALANARSVKKLAQELNSGLGCASYRERGLFGMGFYDGLRAARAPGGHTTALRLIEDFA